MWTERRSGKHQQRSQFDHRGPFERDLTRVTHCPAFRRLQGKTQILGGNQGDFHRTRLTHSLEVASIARSITRNLKMKYESNNAIKEILPCDDLITTISLLHDIGHPPFGHGGEVVLNFMMHEHGGFESNGQTLRLLSKVDNTYGDFGLDLTRRTLLGVLKYPAPYSKLRAKLTPVKPKHSSQLSVNDWLPPKAYLDGEQEDVDWLLLPLSTSDRKVFQSIEAAIKDSEHATSRYKSLDCSIMDIADDIAYGVHDLEDAIYLRLINREQLASGEFGALYADAFPSGNTPLPEADRLLEQLFSYAATERKHAIGALVNAMIIAVDCPQQGVCFEEPLLNYNAILASKTKLFLKHLIEKIYRFVIDSQAARILEYGGQTVVLRLFEAMQSNPESLLSKSSRILYQQAPDEHSRQRVICDLIAQMTDDYAHRLHEQLFGFNRAMIGQAL